MSARPRLLVLDDREGKIEAAPAIERYAARVFARPSFVRSLSEAERTMRRGGRV